MEGSHFLVKKGELDNVLSELIQKQKTVIEDIAECLPLLNDETLTKQLSKKKLLAEQQLKALEEGYIPIVGQWFWDIDTKAKWGKIAVRAILETMPDEVKEVMEQAKESDTFQKIEVNGRRLGDPMLVGTAGKKHFLLAMWANIEGGYSIGFIHKAIR